MKTTTVRRAALTTAGLAVAGGLVFGGTEAFASPSAPAYVTAASAVNASATGSATGNGSGSGKAAACKSAKHPARCALRRKGARDRIALFRKGAHGQSTVKDSSGAYVVHEWQVGKVTAVAGASVTVASGDGTTWTWTTQSATTVRVAGSKGALSGVHVGDTILVRGQRAGSANDAKAIVDPDQSKLKARLG